MKQTFGEFLTQRRKEKNLTQKNLAEKLHVSESTVCKWETNVARPDISLLPDLSEILGVTEHELITSSIDENNRNNAVFAGRWRKMIFSVNMFFYIAYIIALITCFIVNLAVSHTLDWFWIVLTALLLSATFTVIPKYIKKFKLIFIPLSQIAAFLLLIITCRIYSNGQWSVLIPGISVAYAYIIVFLPIIIARYNLPEHIKKNNALISIAVDWIWLLGLLAYICVYNRGDWFFGLALPICGVCLLLPVIVVLILQKLKTNAFIKAGLLFLTCFLWNNIIGYTVNALLNGRGWSGKGNWNPFGANFSIWTVEYISCNVQAIVSLSLLAVAFVLLVVGMTVRLSANKNNAKN